MPETRFVENVVAGLSFALPPGVVALSLGAFRDGEGVVFRTWQGGCVVVGLGVAEVEEADVGCCIASGDEPFCAVDEEGASRFVGLEPISVDGILW